jgi:membrane protease subunit HflC
MEKKLIIRIILVLVIIIVSNSALFEVNEKEQVIITQFGEPIGEAITTPGIHFKIPFIQKANFFDKQFLEWNGDPNEITTKDKTYIFIDTYARWRIVDPLLFFTKLQNVRRAQSRLDDILDGETRNSVAKNSLAEIVRSTNRTFAYNEDSQEQILQDSIQTGRSKIMEEVIKIVNAKTMEMGIEILDVRIKRLKYRDDVLRTVYNRMISERTKISDRFLSEGQGQAEEILGNKEFELRKIRSEANREAEEIQGEGDATATAIYARAYNKNPETRELYRFLKTLETYEKTLSEKDILILSTKSDIFKYLERQ